MKIEKALLTVALMLAAASVAAQTFVSVTPQKRNALIEEYTGVTASTAHWGTRRWTRCRQFVILFLCHVFAFCGISLRNANSCFFLLNLTQFI